MFNKKAGKRTLAVLMSVLMMGNAVLPVVAYGDQNGGG